MKVFVTGGSGFLGSFLCKKLKGLGYQVISPNSKECNLFFSESLNEFKVEKFDFIFHLAAWTQAGDFCIHHPGEQWIKNQKINTNIIDWWFNFQKQAKFVFMGTSCSYSPDSTFTENEYMVGEPIESLYTYAMTKRMLYQGAYSLGKQYGMKWLCLVPSTLYGPNYHTDGRQMHFIFDLIRKIIRAKEFDEKAILWGDGTQKREIIHVNDFVENAILLSNNTTNQIINLGYGEEFQIIDFAKIICKVIDYDFNKIEFDLTKYVGAKSKCLSISKVSDLNKKYKSNLIRIETGIEEVVGWFYHNKAF